MQGFFYLAYLMYLHFPMLKLFYYTGLILSCTGLIIYKLNTMSQEILDQLNAKVLGLKTSLTNIKDDIQKIKDSLPASGGLTEAEVASLSASLDEAGTQAADLDAENA